MSLYIITNMNQSKPNQCIISFSNSKNNYLKALARLGESLRYNWDGEFLAFVGEKTLDGCPSHEDVPYAFKIYAIEAARNAGFDQVLWLDSSCFAIQPLYPIFDHINEHGYIMQDAGHWIGQWTNDFTLKYFGLPRDEAISMRCYGNAGFLGLNFASDAACRFFDEWKLSMDAGCFVGKWDNKQHTESMDERCTGHRHDLSAGSIIAQRMGMILQSSQEWLQYGGPYDQRLNEKIYIMAQGL